MTLIVDASPLVALGDSRDPLHTAVAEVLAAEPGDLIVPAPVSAEVDYLLRHRGGERSAQRFLDDVAAFQQTQFSSASVKLLSDAIAAGTSPLPDPDPVLDGLEMAGKSVFNRACGQCHGNMGGHPSGSTPILQGAQGVQGII